MAFCDRRNEAEAEAASLRRAARFQPIKRPQDLFAFLGGNSRAGIAHSNFKAVTCLIRLHANARTRRAVTDRIVHQIGDHLGQQFGIR